MKYTLAIVLTLTYSTSFAQFDLDDENRDFCKQLYWTSMGIQDKETALREYQECLNKLKEAGSQSLDPDDILRQRQNSRPRNSAPPSR